MFEISRRYILAKEKVDWIKRWKNVQKIIDIDGIRTRLIKRQQNVLAAEMAILSRRLMLNWNSATKKIPLPKIIPPIYLFSTIFNQFVRVPKFQRFWKAQKTPEKILIKFRKFQQIPEISSSNVIFQPLVHEQKGTFASRPSLTNPNLFFCFFVIYLVLCELRELFSFFCEEFYMKQYSVWLHEPTFSIESEYKLWLLNA